MSNHWKLLLAAAAILVLSFAAGTYVALAVLTLLTPVYALLLASIFLMIFLITATVAMAVGRSYQDRQEAAILRREEAIRAEETRDRDAA
jgi:hypothetical protein